MAELLRPCVYLVLHGRVVGLLVYFVLYGPVFEFRKFFQSTMTLANPWELEVGWRVWSFCLYWHQRFCLAPGGNGT